MGGCGCNGIVYAPLIAVDSDSRSRLSPLPDGRLFMSGSSPRLIDDRQRVLDATDIVQVVGEHVALQRKGREYVGLCPFHDDHKPSMYVVPHKQIYHCFSCGAGGNALDFLINYHKLDFREALQVLADRAGITLTPRRSAATRKGQNTSSGQVEISKAELAAVNEAALGFFRAILNHEEHGKTVREILQQRHISPEMVERFSIGAAPDRWDGLVQTLTARGCPAEHLVAAGLAAPRQAAGGYYDVLRNRVIFPIHDQVGRVVAFGGRRINPDDDPKYRNSPETVLFNKSATLYGLYQARKSVIDDRRMIVTEGYTDVIACHQAGFENVVATLGTALTVQHARILKRMCNTIILLFDGDEAGQRAADRALQVFFAEPIDVKIAIMPEGKDPDELLRRENGKELFRQAIDEAVDALAYKSSRIRQKIAPLQSQSARADLVEQELQQLIELGLDRVAPLRRGLILRDLAGILGVDEGAVIAQARRFRMRQQIRSTASPVTDSAKEVTPKSTNGTLDRVPTGAESAQELRNIAEGQLLGCILVDPEQFLSKSPHPGLFLNPVNRALAATLAETKADQLEHLFVDLEDPKVRSAAIHWHETMRNMTMGDADRLKRNFEDCLAILNMKQDEKEEKAESVVTRLLKVKTVAVNPAALARVSETGQD